MDEVAAIELKDIHKSYDDTIALSKLSLTVPKGQSCSVIGPNGAGKTTLVEILVNLRRADLGEVKIQGVNIEEDNSIVSTLGVQLQEADLFPRVKVSEYLKLFSQLYGIEQAPETLLADLGLSKHIDKKFGDLSGGLKQRLLLALSLLNDPEILILDEPTTGLDPIAREDLWAYILNWKSSGRTLLLTSHFMDEVERLCERVVVLSNGRIVADGEVSALLEGMPEGVITLQAAYSHLVKANPV